MFCEGVLFHRSTTKLLLQVLHCFEMQNKVVNKVSRLLSVSYLSFVVAHKMFEIAIMELFYLQIVMLIIVVKYFH